jgi:hypothetical protein
MITNITSKNTNNFICETCNFKCCKKGDWTRHLTTAKHLNLTSDNKNLHTFTSNSYSCTNCDKIYKSRVGLWNHNKKFHNKKEDDDLTDKQLIRLLMKENAEIKILMTEVCKKMQQPTNTTSNMNNSHNNSHNKFNLQFFLNETCKDALNLTEFVNSMQIQLTDLENVGTIGYVNGLSNIIIKNLNALEVNKRPVHCSDIKREVMYVKEENKWEKENDEKDKLSKAIKKVSYKNVLQIQNWQKENPGCEYSHNKKNDEYLQIVNESMGAFTEEENEEYINKIIKNVAKEVIIEK